MSTDASPDLIRPDGWHSGLPIVEVQPDLVDYLGEPLIDYDGIAELYQKELKLKPEQFPTTRLKGDTDEEVARRHIVAGHYYRHSRRTDVNVTALKAAGLSPEEVAATFGHESFHHADRVLHPVRYTVESSAHKAAMIAAGAGFLAEFHGSPLIDSLGTIASAAGGLVVANTLYHQQNMPYERRARDFVVDHGITKKYGDIIIFPKYLS